MGLKDFLYGDSTDKMDAGIEDQLKQKYGKIDYRKPGMAIIETSNHTGTRVLFYEYGCEFCYQWLQVVDQFNQKLDRAAQPIRKIDVESAHPMVNGEDALGSKLPGAPALYLDGILVVGVTSEGFAEGFLKGFLEEEMVFE